MIKLKNFEQNNNGVSCVIIPEDSVKTGTLMVNNNGEIINYDLPGGYEWCINHIHHAARRIRELIKNGKFPTEDVVSWG